MCLIVILFSKLRVYCSPKNGNANFFNSLHLDDVRIPMYQMELHSTACSDNFPLNDNSLLLYKFTHFLKLEIIFSEVLLSASVVHAIYFWKSLVHFRPAGSIEMFLVRILCCGVKTVGRFFHSTLLQFTQLYK